MVSFTESTEILIPATNEIFFSHKRYLILFLFCAVSFVIQSQWVQYEVIADQVKIYYKTDLETINWTMTVWYPIYICGSMIATYLLDIGGIRSGLLIASLLNSIGTALKVFALDRDRFSLMFTGQCLVAGSQLFILNLSPLLAKKWFPPEQATRIIAICFIPCQLGISSGYLLPFIVEPGAKQWQQIEHSLWPFLLCQACVSLVLFFLVIMFFDEKPKLSTLPHDELIRDNTENHNGMWSTIKSLMKNRNFIIVTICYTALQSLFNILAGFQSVLGETAFPGETQLMGISGCIFLLTGIIGALLLAYILDRTRRYKITSFLMSMSVLPLIVGFYFSLKLRNRLAFVATSAVLGFVLSASFPLGQDYVVYVSQPLSEVTTSTILITLSMAFGWLFTEISDKLIQLNTNIESQVMMMLGICAVALISILFVRSSNNESETIETDKETMVFYIQ